MLQRDLKSPPADVFMRIVCVTVVLQMVCKGHRWRQTNSSYLHGKSNCNIFVFDVYALLFRDYKGRL